MIGEILLFTEYDLRKFVNRIENDMFSEIDSLDPNRLLNTSTQDLIEYLVEKYNVDPIQLIEDDIAIDQRETKIDVRNDPSRYIRDRSRPSYITGTAIILEIPFVGDARLFNCQPSTFTYSPPTGSIYNNKLIITLPIIEHDSDRIRQELDRKINDIKKYIEWSIGDLKGWNIGLPEKAKGRIEARKNKILKDQNLVAALGFPLKKRENNPLTYVAPEIRRKLPQRTIIASSQPYVPEPVLELEEYDNIINIIKRTAVMLERSPQAFKEMDEENLRDQFLVPLNSHYEGQATGETFNFNGKTDILIRVQDRNIFIAECKIWRGQKILSEAIDQLLGYTTWRDTKTALIIFNRNKDLSSVLTKIPDTVQLHPNFKKELSYPDDTIFRFILGHNNDMNRELLLTVLVFDVPK